MSTSLPEEAIFLVPSNNLWGGQRSVMENGIYDADDKNALVDLDARKIAQERLHKLVSDGLRKKWHIKGRPGGPIEHRYNQIVSALGEEATENFIENTTFSDGEGDPNDSIFQIDRLLYAAIFQPNIAQIGAQSNPMTRNITIAGSYLAPLMDWMERCWGIKLRFDQALNLSLLAKVKEGNNVQYYKYKPWPDALGCYVSGIPCIIAEFCSDQGRQGDYEKLLILAGTLIRMIYKGWDMCPPMMALYIGSDGQVRSHIFIPSSHSGDRGLPLIFYQRHDYNLHTTVDSVQCALELMNFSMQVRPAMTPEVLTEFRHWLSKLDSNGEINKYSSFATYKPTKKDETGESEREEDRGGAQIVEDSHHVRVLKERGIDALEPLAVGNEFVAAGHSSTLGKVVIKFIPSHEMAEFNIHQQLATPMCPNNYTARIRDSIPTSRGVLVVTLHRTALRDMDPKLLPTMAPQLATQLFQAVEFMHSQKVAHLDLKPENIVLDLHSGRLEVIDYGTSVRLERLKKSTVKGFIGTNGWVVPEVSKNREFNPVKADLYATGKIIQTIWAQHLHPAQPSHASILRVTEELMDTNPSSRPGIRELLGQINPPLNNNNTTKHHRRKILSSAKQ